MDQKSTYNKKEIIIAIIICLVALSLPFLIYFGRKAYHDYKAQKSLHEHFGDVTLSDEEIDALARQIVSPESASEEISSSENTSYSSEELEILQSDDFQLALATAMVEIQPADIIDISISIEGTDHSDLMVVAYVTTDLRTLSVSMSKLSLTNTWIYYLISDADTGHIYWCPASTMGYADIYDYYTDEIISEKSK